MATQTRQGEEELLAALYGGMFEQPLWSRFLHLLKEQLDAHYVSLIFRRRDAPRHDMVELVAGEKVPLELQRRYFHDLNELDPVRYHELSAGRIYAFSEFVDADNPRHAEYIAKFLAPMNADHLRIVRVVEPSGYSAWLNFCRRESDFSADALDLVGTLAGHLELALRSYAAVENVKAREQMYADVIHKLNFGCLTLDASGCIVELDATAERLLRESHALRRHPQGRLVLSSSAADRVLRDAIRDFAANPGGQPRAVHLADEPYLDMLLAPMRHKAVSGAVTPVLLAYVHGDEQASADRCSQLVELFGLSRTEARLALALSRGQTIREAATDVGITLETARNYSKRIFSKTGTHRQAELVRLILVSVLALA